MAMKKKACAFGVHGHLADHPAHVNIAQLIVDGSKAISALAALMHGQYVRWRLNDQNIPGQRPSSTYSSVAAGGYQAPSYVVSRGTGSFSSIH